MTSSPVPVEVADELRRVVRRWQQLPADRALACMPGARQLVEQLAGEPVPDLGPAIVMDQLSVMVFDAFAAGRGEGVGERLAAFRQSL